ncbi:Protein BREAST CANCER SUSCEPTIBILITY 1 [Phytophthora citrophthora]|uniref:Protein BREAST CANCER SUSCEPTIBILITY 1 n=1 Tax=Phytophthora citrophthora TaxID=4793 RepID=A0AAD9GGM4_9STRA|nr:Protein BREAST CANCER SUSCEPTIBILITY 1 [Phytophthora citrophthora]
MASWTLKRLERAVESFSEQLQCAICLCAYDNPVSLPCNHCFCQECIHRALELKAVCPICKTPAKKRRLRYDTTVQELLRATEMLCAAPAPLTTELQPQTPKKETRKAVTSEKKAEEQVKVAELKYKPNATPKKMTSPRRASPSRAKRNSQRSPQSQTLMDMWVGGGSLQLKNGLKIKKEKISTPTRRSSPRRGLVQEMNSQLTASQMSPALFEIPAPSVAQKESTSGVDIVGISDDEVDKNKLMPWRRRPAEDLDITTDAAADETQLESSNVNQLASFIRPRRRKSRGDESAADAIVAETQLEEVYEAMEEDTPVRQRSSSDITQDEIQHEQLEPAVHAYQTPRKRRRSRTSGNTRESKGNGMSNGEKSLQNGSTESCSLAVDSQAEPLPEIVDFHVGDVVHVIERQWTGINKQGGAARITKVYDDGFYAVKFVIGGRDNHVPGFYIRTPSEDLVSDSTPSRSVRKRQRRQPSDAMSPPYLLTVKTEPSPQKKVKTNVRSITPRKYSGMVFLCSGFKEDRMGQIEEWAELLGAQIVQHWSNNVTHLIVKCVSSDKDESDNFSTDDSNSDDSSPKQKRGKHKQVNGNSASGRWVKIRSLKYLKALVGGRWIVSEEWLQGTAVDACGVLEHDTDSCFLS